MRWSNLVYPKLTQRQREYVLGAVLCDDSLAMNQGSLRAHLRAQQSQAHKDYLMWKYQIMKNHTISAPHLVESNRYGRVHQGIRFHTRATPDLTELYTLCYPNGGKRLSHAWLQQLTAFSLAVWYLDDGTYAPGPGRQFCMLYTGAFPYSQQRLIQRYLKERWSITGCVIQRNRQQWCLRFTRAGTQQLLSVIEPYVTPIPSMCYKLGYPEQAWKRPVQESMDGYCYYWRKHEDLLLTKRYGHVAAQALAARLGRTLNAVYLRANKLGLNGWQADRVSDDQGIYTN